MSNDSSKPDVARLGIAGRIARSFIDTKLTPLLVITSILLGAAATLLLPREEEPQIKVPMVDVLVSMPGLSAREVEERATRPMEKLLWEIPGVEYIYSTSREGESLAIVRFKVGEDIERSLVNLNQKLQANFDRIPQGVSFPLIKPKSIDDVPILSLTLWSERYDHHALRRVARELTDELEKADQVAATEIKGGLARELKVRLDAGRLASHGLSPLAVMGALEKGNLARRAGELSSGNRDYTVDAGSFLSDAAGARRLVVSVQDGRPVYLEDVAQVTDGVQEPTDYVFFGLGPAAAQKGLQGGSADYPAVTISVAKRTGANATWLAGGKPHSARSGGRNRGPRP